MSLLPRSELSWFLLDAAQPKSNSCRVPLLRTRRPRPRSSAWSCKRFRQSEHPEKAVWLLHYFFAPREADDRLSWGELAGRCSCIITPSRKQYRDINIPEGDSRAWCSAWWCGSLEPPKLEYELLPHFTREQPNVRGSVPEVTYRAKQSIFILNISVSPFIKWDNTYFIR